jgi:phage terminase large subunit-like protein
VIRRVVNAYHTHKADVIVAEDQSGGDWLLTALRHVDQNTPFKKVHAMRRKFIRAQPVAMLMEQGRIHHADTAEEFERLEERELADMRAKLAAALVPAPPVLQGEAEEPMGHT